MVNPLAFNYYNMSNPATTNSFSSPLNSPAIHQSFANASVFPGYNYNYSSPLNSPIMQQSFANTAVLPGYNYQFSNPMSYNNYSSPTNYSSFNNPMAFNAINDMFGMSNMFGPANNIPVSGSGSVLQSGLSMANPMQNPLGYNAVSDMFGLNNNTGTSGYNSFSNFATSYDNDSSLQRLIQLGDLMFNGGQSKAPSFSLTDLLLNNTSTNSTADNTPVNDEEEEAATTDIPTVNDEQTTTTVNNEKGLNVIEAFMTAMGIRPQSTSNASSEGDSKLRSLFAGLDALTTNGPLPPTNYGGVSWNFSLQEAGGDGKLQSLFSGIDALTTNGPLPATNYGGVSMDFSLQGDRQILSLFSGLNQFG